MPLFFVRANRALLTSSGHEDDRGPSGKMVFVWVFEQSSSRSSVVLTAYMAFVTVAVLCWTMRVTAVSSILGGRLGSAWTYHFWWLEMIEYLWWQFGACHTLVPTYLSQGLSGVRGVPG
jgi:hypothetical protein